MMVERIAGLNKKSFWRTENKTEEFPPIQKNITVDAAVIGGGITGLCTAYLLQLEGIKTALIEAEQIGHGTTGNTTGHLTEISDTNFYSLIQKHNQQTAELAARSLRESIRLFEEIIRNNNIECGYRKIPGYYYNENPAQYREIQNEYESAKKAGLDAEFMETISLPFPVKGGIKYSGQGIFHPLKFIFGLAEIIKENCIIFERTRVTDIEESEPYIIKTSNGLEIRANSVVYATHTPLNIHITQMEMKVGRSYVIGAKLNNIKIEDALYWDNEDPYHYFNLMYDEKNTPILMIGGGDHIQGDEGKETDHINRLIKWAKEKFGVEEISYLWSGQEYIPADGLPYIGLNPFSDSKYIATGFSGNGLGYGITAARIISSMISGKKNEYSEIYSPSRINISGIKNIAELNVHAVKHIIIDRFDDSILKPIEEILPGEGGLTEIDNERYAVYKDEEGNVTKLSPICEHAKCVVHWNNFEKTWDCPCHGSRFGCTGKIIEGPVTIPLKEKGR